MASWNNPVEVWFTLAALNMYQDLKDVELLLVDNAGNAEVKKICSNAGCRYELFTEKQGPQPAKNKVFELAEKEFVLCIDSHVLLWPGAISKLKIWVKENWNDAKNLIQAPMAYINMRKAETHMTQKWQGGMWGTWGGAVTIEDLSKEPYEILNMGTGLIGCRKDSWLGFNPKCEGFGGAEGYIQEKYRQAGRTTISLPFLIWMHNFHKENSSYRLSEEDKMRNYMIEFQELGLDPQPVVDHFGDKAWKFLDKKT
jgi:hypothetical protein